MRITTDQIVLINGYLAKEGVICIEDNLDKHPELSIENKTVMAYIKTLVSKGYAIRTFVWNHAYVRLSDEGIAWIKQKMCLGDDELPVTHAGMVYEMGFDETIIKEE